MANSSRLVQAAELVSLSICFFQKATTKGGQQPPLLLRTV